MKLEPGALIAVPDALTILPVSRSSLYRILKAGHVASVRVTLPGGKSRLFVVRDSLERYATQGPPAPEPLDIDGLLERIREGSEPDGTTDAVFAPRKRERQQGGKGNGGR